ncbi:MAG: hypothetical protein ACRD5H_13055 [Nitrososphaerales archaeon]
MNKISARTKGNNIILLRSAIAAGLAGVIVGIVTLERNPDEHQGGGLEDVRIQE